MALYCDMYKVSDQTKCILKNVCKDNKCGEMCMKCYKFYYYVNTSNLIKSYMKTEISGGEEDIDGNYYHALLNIANDILNFINEGKNLVICGDKPGSGKTFWATKIMQKYIYKMCIYNINENLAIFVPEVELLHQIERNRFNKGFEILDKYENCNLLTIDDIGMFKKTDFQQQELFRLIDYRVTHNKTTIFTSNFVTKAQYTEVLGERLCSRIYETSLIIELKDDSRREF